MEPPDGVTAQRSRRLLPNRAILDRPPWFDRREEPALCGQSAHTPEEHTALQEDRTGLKTLVTSSESVVVEQLTPASSSLPHRLAVLCFIFWPRYFVYALDPAPVFPRTVLMAHYGLARVVCVVRCPSCPTSRRRFSRWACCELASTGQGGTTTGRSCWPPRFGNPDLPRRPAPGARILRFLRFDVLQIDVSDRCCIDVVSYDTKQRADFFFTYFCCCSSSPAGCQVTICPLPGLDLDFDLPLCSSQLARGRKEKKNHRSHVSYFHLFSQLAGRLAR